MIHPYRQIVVDKIMESKSDKRRWCNGNCPLCANKYDMTLEEWKDWSKRHPRRLIEANNQHNCKTCR
jgi:hypothetical protein